MADNLMSMAENNLYCFGGDDVSLIYYFRCKDCETVILENRAIKECLDPWECPTCYPKDSFPFRYFTKEQLRKNNRALEKLVMLFSE